ncbi:MAG: hypothetical protein JWP22_4220 [Ramlibacter sp.]|jgi:hypothetical protein|nr:hypothetical protein [Ramlibacter sp.]MDB5915545.1 hypothetical protein [Ramlibacter sp.]
MKVLSPTVHGVLDYALAVLFLVLPGVLDFPPPAAVASYVIGVVYIAASLITRYPLGVLKLLPFPAHGVIESLMAIAWIALPWVMGFAEHGPARNFFVVAGVGLLVVVALTNYRAAELDQRLRRAPV